MVSSWEECGKMAREGFKMTLNNKDISLFREGLFKPTKRQMQSIANYVNGTGVGNVFLQRVARLTRKSVRRNFRAKVDSKGRGWAPLEESTKATRKRKGFAQGPPLIASKKLFSSATGAQTVSFSRRGILIRPRVGRFSQGSKYALHNKETTESTPNPARSGGDIPGRQFYYLRDPEYNIIADIMLQDMVRNLTNILKGTSQEGIGMSVTVEGTTGVV